MEEQEGGGKEGMITKSSQLREEKKDYEFIKVRFKRKAEVGSNELVKKVKKTKEEDLNIENIAEVKATIHVKDAKSDKKQELHGEESLCLLVEEAKE